MSLLTACCYILDQSYATHLYFLNCFFRPHRYSRVGTHGYLPYESKGRSLEASPGSMICPPRRSFGRRDLPPLWWLWDQLVGALRVSVLSFCPMNGCFSDFELFIHNLIFGLMFLYSNIHPTLVKLQLPK